MTRIIFSATMLFCITTLAVSSHIPVYTQYGQPLENPTILEDFPGESINATTVVNGSTGDTIPVNPVAGVGSLNITLKNNVSGSLDVGVVSSQGLPGDLPVGDPLSLYKLNFSGFTKDDVDVDLIVKVPASRFSQFSSIKGYQFNSPAEEVVLTSEGLDADGNYLYSIGSTSYEAIAVMGENESDTTIVSSLIRSGGNLMDNNLFMRIFSTGFIGLVVGVIYSIMFHNNSSRTSK